MERIHIDYPCISDGRTDVETLFWWLPGGIYVKARRNEDNILVGLTVDGDNYDPENVVRVEFIKETHRVEVEVSDVVSA